MLKLVLMPFNISTKTILFYFQQTLITSQWLRSKDWSSTCLTNLTASYSSELSNKKKELNYMFIVFLVGLCDKKQKEITKAIKRSRALGEKKEN